MQDHHVLSIQFLWPEVELATFEMNVAYACTRSGSPHNVIHSASSNIDHHTQTFGCEVFNSVLGGPLVLRYRVCTAISS